MLGEIERTPECNHTGISLVSDGNQYAAAFPCVLPNRFTISNGKLYYEDGNGLEIHEFVPDYSDVHAADPTLRRSRRRSLCTHHGIPVQSVGDLDVPLLRQRLVRVGGVSVYEGNDTILAFTDNRAVATLEGVITLDEQVLHRCPRWRRATACASTEKSFTTRSSQRRSRSSGRSMARKGDQARRFRAAPRRRKGLFSARALLAPDDSLT